MNTTPTPELKCTALYGESINGHQCDIRAYSVGERPAHRLVASVHRDGQLLEHEYELDGTNRQFVDVYLAAKAWCKRTAKTGPRGCSA